MNFHENREKSHDDPFRAFLQFQVHYRDCLQFYFDREIPINLEAKYAIHQLRILHIFLSSELSIPNEDKNSVHEKKRL